MIPATFTYLLRGSPATRPHHLLTLASERRQYPVLEPVPWELTVPGGIPRPAPQYRCSLD